MTKIPPEMTRGKACDLVAAAISKTVAEHDPDTREAWVYGYIDVLEALGLLKIIDQVNE